MTAAPRRHAANSADDEAGLLGSMIATTSPADYAALRIAALARRTA